MNVHPELADTLATLPIKRSSFADIELTRKNFTAMMGKLPLDVSNVDIGVTEIIGPDDNPVPLGIYRPKGATGPLPAVLHFHGGSFAYGRSEPDQDRTAVAICEQAGAITISVDYRLAPQHRYPAGVEDCYSALEWVADNAIELGIDPERIAITGKSAGGGLSAAVALMSGTGVARRSPTSRCSSRPWTTGTTPSPPGGSPIRGSSTARRSSRPTTTTCPTGRTSPPTPPRPAPPT